MFAIHFAVAAIVAGLSAAYPSAGWAYAALAIFLSMTFGLLVYSPPTFLLLVPLLALRITEFMSGAAIESGAYMTETAAYGRATGAFTRLLLIYILFFATAAFATEAMWPKLRRHFIAAPALWEKQAKLIWNCLLVVMVIASIYLLRLGINNGFPLFSHIDRFAYLGDLDSAYYTFFLHNRLVIVPLLGALFALPSYRSRGFASAVWLVATSVLFGEKFTSLLMILSIFAIPAGLVHIANDRPIPFRTIGLISLAIVVITVPAVLVAYGGMTDFKGATRRYGERVALQGQLWYRTDERYLALFRLDDQALAADVASWVKPSEQDPKLASTRYGLYYVMERFTPTNRLGWNMEGGNGFVFSLYPYFLMTMGLVGLLIVSSIIALYHVVVMRLLAASLADANWLASVALGRVMSSIYAAYSTGYLWLFFGINTLFVFAVGVFLLWEGGRRASVSRRLYDQAAQRLSERARA